MYKKISNNEKITRNIRDVHSADNYLTKETTENVSLAVTRLNGVVSDKIKNERVYYFISADVSFIMDNEKVHCQSGDVLYFSKGTNYSAEENSEAVTVNVL